MIGFHRIDNRLQKICRQSLEFIQYDYGINYVMKLAACRWSVAKH